jgi:hypothetical protein
MATILTKKRDTTGAPGAGDLTNAAGGAELAVNTLDKILYTKDSGGNVVDVGFGTSSTVTITNKTISADNNTLSGIAASSFVLSNASGNIDGSAAQKAIPSGAVVGTTDSQTLSTKTIHGDVNTLTVDGTNGVGFRKVPQSGSDKTTSYTLATGDIGKFIGVGTSGSITIPDATFAAGDVVSVFNNTTGNITITCTITTAYIAGTDSDKASVTLATRGVATILFISGTVCVITGNVT